MLREGGFLEDEDIINNTLLNIRKIKLYVFNNFGNEVKLMVDIYLLGNIENLKSIILRVYYVIF